MGLRNILTQEDPQLTKKSREITQFNERIHELIDDMRETLLDAIGMGIAAPQVGVLRRVVLIYNNDDEIVEMINPVIIESEGEQDGPEGCLSSPGLWGLVIRPQRVKVKFKDRNGVEQTLEAEDLSARACCHEIDHLDGILFSEKAYKFIDESEVADYRTDEEGIESVDGNSDLEI